MVRISQAVESGVIRVKIDFTEAEAKKYGIKCGGPGSGVPGPCPLNKPESKPKKEKLTADDIFAIEMWTGSSSGDIRKCQNTGVGCNEDLDGNGPTSEIIRNLSTALNKLPDYKGSVYRGVKIPRDRQAEFLAKLQSGDVSDKGFMSSSKSMKIAKTFAEGDDGVIIKIKSKKGKDISKWSTSMDALDVDEKEVVIMPGSKFRYAGVHKSKGTLVVSMEEIE